MYLKVLNVAETQQVTIDVVEHEAAEALLTVEAAIPEDGGWTVPGLSATSFPHSTHETLNLQLLLLFGMCLPFQIYSCLRRAVILGSTCSRMHLREYK